MNTVSLSARRGVSARNASAAAAMIFILALVFAPLFVMHAAARWNSPAADAMTQTVFSARAPAPAAHVE